MTKKKTILVDFDGVIHGYSRGWQGGVIYDPVVPGFFDWLRVAREHFSVAVYSSRSKDPDARIAMESYLHGQVTAYNQGRPADETVTAYDLSVVHEKPPAWVTIDDRCVLFRGDWTDPRLRPQALLAFEPWTVPGSLVHLRPSEYDALYKALQEMVDAYQEDGTPMDAHQPTAIVRALVALGQLPAGTEPIRPEGSAGSAGQAGQALAEGEVSCG